MVWKRLGAMISAAIVLAGSAGADLGALKPAGWSTERKGEMVVHSAPVGLETIMVREITGTDDPLDGAKTIAEAVFGTGMTPTRSSTSMDGAVAVYDAELSVSAATITLNGLGIKQSGNAILAVLHIGEAGRDGLGARRAALRETLKAMAPAADPAPNSGAGSVSRPKSAGGAGKLTVAHTVFDLDYVGGVGGFTYPEYTPVYLLADGRACRCTEVAPTALTEADYARQSRADTGTWTQAGGGFEIRYRDGSKPERVKASLAKPTAPPAATALRGRYRSIGGGGSVALGGGVMTANVEDLTFYADGSFSEQSFRSGSAPGGVGWSKRGTAGTFNLDGAVLTLDYRDGRQVQTSVYYSSKRKRTADFGQMGVLWIGGEGFKREE
ncbi:MAG: hypothetical protein AAF253_10810 [Pseudomonadota bacterium]